MNLRLLADENCPSTAVMALRAVGHDVLWVQTDNLGATDEQVLQQAQRDARILITFDKDFGELAFRSKLPAQSGIILFRITKSSPAATAKIIVKALASRTDWASHFSVVDDTRIRMIPLPD